MDTVKPYTFDRVVRIIIGLAVVLLVFLLIRRLETVLFPFALAWLMAYLLHPFVLFFQNKLRFRNRILSVITTLLVFAGIVTGLFFLLIPAISDEVQKLSEIVSLYVQGIDVDTVIPVAWQNEIRDFLLQLDIQSVLKDENMMQALKKIAPQLWNVLNSSLSVLLGLTMVVVVAMYLIFILIDYERINRGLFKIIPQKYRSIASEVIHDLESGMNRYFRGQALIALIVSILFMIGFSITGLPLAILFGMLMGVLNMIPYLKTIAIIPGSLLAFLQSAETGQSFSSVLLWLVIIFVAVQLVEDLILVPKIMGKFTGLNPAIMLLSLSVWGSLMGMVGLIIALPMTTLIISYYKRFVLKENTKPTQDENPESVEEVADVAEQ
ncbi:MAG: hypothetical protein H6Q20_672 [Bacteroidetes bacterium]|jgi:predicted PurR-regulated permease PerM|nr:hypothetical protein [Bacteroidota bacterium]